MPKQSVLTPAPFAPPNTETDALDWLQMIRSRRVGPATFRRLLTEFGTAAAALDALPGIAASAGARDYEICPRDKVLAEYEAGKSSGARLIAIGTALYPPLLAELETAPPLLWVSGRVDLLTTPTLAMVGARNASALGGRMAQSLAKGLGAAGYTIVSGLARGIDASAHMAALPTGTIAVVAGGVDVTYPRENAELAKKIRDQGVCVSEQPMGLAPQARHFPQRNRLISGLAQALIVVEAAVKSGSLITAKDALDQGREVMAVPGHPFDARAGGTNQLLRDGALLVRGANDVIEALPSLAPPAPAPVPPPAPDRPTHSDLSATILALISTTPCPEDELVERLSAPSADVSRHLSELELTGQITRQAGGLLLNAAP